MVNFGCYEAEPVFVCLSHTLLFEQNKVQDPSENGIKYQ
jgi:hypothetical protein